MRRRKGGDPRARRAGETEVSYERRMRRLDKAAERMARHRNRQRVGARDDSAYADAIAKGLAHDDDLAHGAPVTERSPESVTRSSEPPAARVPRARRASRSQPPSSPRPLPEWTPPTYSEPLPQSTPKPTWDELQAASKVERERIAQIENDRQQEVLVSTWNCISNSSESDLIDFPHLLLWRAGRAANNDSCSQLSDLSSSPQACVPSDSSCVHDDLKLSDGVLLRCEQQPACEQEGNPPKGGSRSCSANGDANATTPDRGPPPLTGPTVVRYERPQNVSARAQRRDPNEPRREHDEAWLAAALAELPPLGPPVVAGPGIVPQPLDERIDAPRLTVARPRVRLRLRLAAELLTLIHWLKQARAVEQFNRRGAMRPLILRFAPFERALVEQALGHACSISGLSRYDRDIFLDDRPNGFGTFAGLLARFIALRARLIIDTTVEEIGRWMLGAQSPWAMSDRFCAHTTERIVDLFQVIVAPELRAGTFVIRAEDGGHWLSEAIAG